MLLKLEYNGIFLPMCVIVASMAVLQLALFARRIRDTEGHASLAYLVDIGGIPVVSAIGFVSLLALIAARLVMNYTPSKSIYALLTLPVKRRHVYMAKLASSLLAGFMLLAAQMALLLVFNTIAGMRGASVLRWYDYTLEITRRNADFYLSMLDSFFLRTIFPPDLFSLLFSAVMLGGSVCVMLFGAVIVKAGKWPFATLWAVSWLALLFFAFPLTGNSLSFNIVILVALAACSLTTCIKGAILFEKGEVAG